MADETSGSYIARADVLWTKLRARQVKLEDLQAFIVLRGSNLTPDEKKRVIMDADKSLDGSLTVT